MPPVPRKVSLSRETQLATLSTFWTCPGNMRRLVGFLRGTSLTGSLGVFALSHSLQNLVGYTLTWHNPLLQIHRKRNHSPCFQLSERHSRRLSHWLVRLRRLRGRVWLDLEGRTNHPNTTATNCGSRRRRYGRWELSYGV